MQEHHWSNKVQFEIWPGRWNSDARVKQNMMLHVVQFVAQTCGRGSCLSACREGHITVTLCSAALMIMGLQTSLGFLKEASIHDNGWINDWLLQSSNVATGRGSTVSIAGTTMHCASGPAPPIHLRSNSGQWQQGPCYCSACNIYCVLPSQPRMAPMTSGWSC